MGHMMAWLTKDLEISQDTAVVYVTQYSEVNALERYLAGFPSLSPLLFQTSIHPGAVQQVWISRKKELALLYPISGDTHIVASALQNALFCGAQQVLILGGEDQSSWLYKHNIGSQRAFGFCIELGPLGAPQKHGILEYRTESIGSTPSLLSLANQFATNGDLRVADPNEGHYHLRWNPSDVRCFVY